jgi:branched-chain amino acid aminotransferase
MKESVKEYIYWNGSIVSSNTIDYELQKDTLQIYEVIRIMDKVCLFLDDHLERLANSLQIIQFNFKVSELKQAIHKLLEANNYATGNIKLVIYITNNKADIAIYYIQHSYPSDNLYNSGVALKSLKVERSNPNAKIIHNEIKEKVSAILYDETIYEVLLVSNDGSVTEGSRSNVFFVNSMNQVVTAPIDKVLPGITRKYILQSCNNMNIKIIEANILFNTLSQFPAAFITGTSPKVLAVNKIDNLTFQPNNVLIQQIANEYDTLLREYVKNFKW